MTNSKKLKSLIKASGLKIGYIAEQLGISRYGLTLKINNDNEFKTSEVNKICELLNITDLEEKENIFFASLVDL